MKVFLAEVDEVREGDALEKEFFGRSVLLTRQRGDLRVYANACMHLGGPLQMQNGCLTCAWHGARFDPRSGSRVDGPAPQRSHLMRIPFAVEDGKVFYVYGE